MATDTPEEPHHLEQQARTNRPGSVEPLDALGGTVLPDHERWEYCVIHVNEDTSQQPSATAASEKLGGSMSPDFIERQFPDQYGRKPSPHPAEQLGRFLNKMGSKGWMLTNITNLGPLQMYIFRRRKLN
ncbi:hypothetical protein [Candidatus Synechococcus spongiarum]|uniref:hypothetical protein n=1 Tax=Candidatus Synechococcus spongiarum TaxID=431041 RepID=UPI000993DC30|nr:hypothetical protein [Candidatus Synechococcus spongiarum]MCY4359784.1 hypothetical protein [Cyanobacteria bacterium MAG APA_bin_95]